jgi:hypothetical protein
MTAFTKGQSVKQVLPAPIEGTVAGFSLDQENGEVLVLVEYTDADNQTHSRYFKQSELS